MGCRFRSYCTLDDTCHAYGSLYNQCDSSDNIYSGQQSRCSSPSPPPRPSGCYQTSCGGDQASCYQFSFSGSSLEVTETLQSGGDNCLFNFNFGLSYVDSDRVRFEENGTCSISSCSSSSCTCSSSISGMFNYNLRGDVLTLVDGSQTTFQLTEATCKSYDNCSPSPPSPPSPPRLSGCYQTPCGGGQASCYQFSFSGSSLEVTQTINSGGVNCLFDFNFGLSYLGSDSIRFEEKGACSISSCSSSSCTCSNWLHGTINYNLQGDVLTLVDSTQAVQLTEATCKSYDNSDNCSSNSSSSMGLIIGIVCAVGVVLLLVALALVWCYCVRPQHQGDGVAESAVVMKQV